MSFGKSSKNQTTTQTTQTDPWGPTQKYLKGFLGDIDAARSLAGPSGDQLDAFARLKSRAAEGHPWTAEIERLTGDTFGAGSRAGMVDAALGDLKSQLGDTASGKFLDFETNPYVKKILGNVGDDVSNRIHSLFVGAGRDPVGNVAGQQAIAREVSKAQLPVLADLYARERANQVAAAQSLFGAGVGAATTGQQLETGALTTRAGGVDAAKAALEARDRPENMILSLDEQLKRMPLEDLSLYASLLLPVAGLGSQQQGTSVSKGRGTSFGLSL